MVLLKLDKKRFDKARETVPGMLEKMAKAVNCSVSCIRMMRWRDGYGARSDGQARLKRVNNWLLRRVPLVVLLMLLAGCTSTEPVEQKCKSYQFSPTTGRDTVVYVSCDADSLPHGGLGTK